MISKVLCTLLIVSLTYANCELKATYGYSSDTESLAPNKCYLLEENIGDYVSDLSLDKGHSLNDIEDMIIEKKGMELDVSLSGSLVIPGLELIFPKGLDIGISLLNYSKSEELFKKTQSYKFAESTFYYNRITRVKKYGLLGIEEDALSDTGKFLYNGTWDYFGITCGDKIIESIEEVALLVINLTIVFDSREDQVRFKSQSKLDILGGSLASFSKSFQSFTGFYNSNTRIVISASQIGGQAERVSRLVSSENISTCHIKKMEPCLKLIDDIISYASEDFVNQLEQNPNSFALLDESFIRAFDAADALLEIPDSLVTPKIKKARESLKSAYKSVVSLEKELYNKHDIESLNKLIEKNKQMFNSDLKYVKMIKECYFDPSTCVENERKVLKGFKDHYGNFLNYFHRDLK